MGSAVLANVFRASSESIRKSAELRKRISVSISESDAMISRSRALLSDVLVSGAPLLRNAIWEEAPLPEPAEPKRERAAESRLVESSTELIRVVERTFTGETVSLDGKHFVDCIVENCVLEYNGGPVVLEGTNFAGCRFQFGGSAAMTVSMLECFSLFGESGGPDTDPASPSLTGVRVN